MHSEMKQAEKHLTGMEKWCGLCVPWGRRRKIKDTDDASWNNPLAKDQNVKAKQPSSSQPDAPQGPYIQRINNDAREDEMEDNMQAVGGMLSNLKNMAADMGGEIERQNKQLDRITNKVFCFLERNLCKIGAKKLHHS